jgi:RimJ/RimL family protein N-acetyltransferase
MPDVASLGPRLLKGRFVALEPVEPRHHAALKQASSERSIFRHMPFNVERTGFEALLAWSEREVARGTQIAYAVRRLADDRIVGSTSYLAIAPEHGRVEIGATWYEASAQGTAVNPEAKCLLLENAFASGYHRAEFKTDANNAQSRAALLKLGAKEEGTFRGHMWISKGYFRDTVYFSILANEWPAVRSALESRLASFA